MDITNQKNSIHSSFLVNGQSVNYLVCSLLGVLFYLFVSKGLGLFLPGVTGQIIAAALIGPLYFLAARKLIFLKSRQSILLQGLLYVLTCVADGAVFYLFTGLLPGFISIEPALGAFFAVLLILISNYFFFHFIVFKSRIPAANRKNGRLYRCVTANRFVLLSGICAAFILLFVFFCFNAYPFGDTTILRMDLYHQYGPLFGELYDRIQNGQSLIYSWESGGGSLFLGNFFNYLSSPLSLLIFLFDRDQIPGAISMMIVVKAALSASSFTLYLKLSKKRTGFTAAGFGLLYAFCGFFLAYYWNVMWIDALYLLPMIALGIERIISKGRFKLYTISLILMMFSNYYMSFIICIFSVLYFLCYYFGSYNISDKITVVSSKSGIARLWQKRFVRAGFLFAGASLLAAAVSAVALLPTYQALQASSATAGTFPTELTNYFDLFDFLANHLPGVETTIRSSGGEVLPNIYSGAIVLILIPLYMMNKSIATRKKVMNVLLLAILVVSFNTNMLNYIWHAFHFPNDLPYRFSFLYTFVLLNMAFEVLTKLKSISYKEIMLVGMLVLFFIALAEKTPNKYFKEGLTLYVSIAFTLLYACILTLIKKKSLGISVLSFLLFLTMGVELIVGSTDSYVLSQSHKSYAGDYADYQKVFDEIAQLEKDSADKPRTEQFHLRTRMDPCWYGYNGISTFSSMAYEKMSRLQYSLGMFGNRINSYTYNPQTPVYNSMFALKYFIGTDQNIKPNSEYYAPLFTNNAGDVTVYENKYYLPLAFCVNPSIENWYVAEGNPFEVQNSFIQSACGVMNVLKPLSASNTSRTNIKSFNFSGNGTFQYEKYNEGDASFSFTITPTQNGNLYLYASSQEAKSATIVSDNVNLTYNFDEPYILDAGYHFAGEEVTVTFTAGQADTANLTFYSYMVDKAAFETAYGLLNAGAYEINESSENYLKGTVNAAQNSVLYTSVPYDKGWRVMIDGKQAELMKVGDALMGVSIPQGQHTVEFRYIPAGLLPGAAVSAVALIGIAAYTSLFYMRTSRRRRRKQTDGPMI